jgi:hypothetical protein
MLAANAGLGCAELGAAAALLALPTWSYDVLYGQREETLCLVLQIMAALVVERVNGVVLFVMAGTRDINGKSMRVYLKIQSMDVPENYHQDPKKNCRGPPPTRASIGRRRPAATRVG